MILETCKSNNLCYYDSEKSAVFEKKLNTAEFFRYAGYLVIVLTMDFPGLWTSLVESLELGG